MAVAESQQMRPGDGISRVRTDVPRCDRAARGRDAAALSKDELRRGRKKDGRSTTKEGDVSSMAFYQVFGDAAAVLPDAATADEIGGGLVAEAGLGRSLRDLHRGRILSLGRTVVPRSECGTAMCHTNVAQRPGWIGLKRAATLDISSDIKQLAGLGP
jgi:hypothetical protein